MRACSVRLFFDSQRCTTGYPAGRNDVFPAERTYLDKFFIVNDKDDGTVCEDMSREFALRAMHGGISFVDDENANSTRFIPPRDVVGFFLIPSRDVSESLVKENDDKCVEALDGRP